MDRTPRHDPPTTPATAADDAGDAGVETWEPDAHELVRPTRVGGPKARLGASVPSAIGGVLLVCAMAFGATLQSTPPPAAHGGSTAGADAAGGNGGNGGGTALADHQTSDHGGTTAGDHPGGDVQPGTEAPGSEDGPGAGDQPNAGSGDEPGPTPTTTHEPEATPTPDRTEPTPRPTEKPAPKPTEKPAPTEPGLGLTLGSDGGAVSIDWTACTLAGADAYKVVRSTNEHVTWPAGDGDTLVVVIGVGGATAVVDEHAPAGKKAWYRVFCVHHTGDGYAVLTTSPVRGITVPGTEPTPTPAPDACEISLEVALDGGHPVLHWTACDSDQFSHYRIVRTTGDETKLMAEVAGAGNTTWADTSAETGHTYQYLIQAKGLIGTSYVLLGTTDFVGVTVE